MATVKVHEDCPFTAEEIEDLNVTLYNVNMSERCPIPPHPSWIKAQQWKEARMKTKGINITAVEVLSITNTDERKVNVSLAIEDWQQILEQAYDEDLTEILRCRGYEVRKTRKPRKKQ